MLVTKTSEKANSEIKEKEKMIDQLKEALGAEETDETAEITEVAIMNKVQM